MIMIKREEKERERERERKSEGKKRETKYSIKSLPLYTLPPFFLKKKTYFSSQNCQALLLLSLSLLFNSAKSTSNYLHPYISYTYHWNIIPGQRYRQYEILVNTRDWAHWTGGIAKVSFLEEGYLFPDCLYFSLSFSLISLLRVKPEPIDTEIPTCLTRQSTRNP